MRWEETLGNILRMDCRNRISHWEIDGGTFWGFFAADNTAAAAATDCNSLLNILSRGKSERSYIYNPFILSKKCNKTGECHQYRGINWVNNLIRTAEIQDDTFSMSPAVCWE